MCRLTWNRLTKNVSYSHIQHISLRNKRVRASSSTKVGTRAKKKKGMTREGGGGGGGVKDTLARKPHDFEKLRSPTNVASDRCGAGHY